MEALPVFPYGDFIIAETGFHFSMALFKQVLVPIMICLEKDYIVHAT